MINSISHQNADSAFRQLSSSMLTPQKAPELQPFNLGLNKKSFMNSGSKQGMKPKPSTDRTHSMNETFNDFMEGIEQSSQVMQLHTSQKLDLLQKRKQYAESIRQKNRCSMKQQKGNKRSHHHNQTLNQSLSFTPPKDSLIGNSESHCRMINKKHKLNHMQEIEKQYYSMKRFSNMEHSNSKVFAETNMNMCNSVIMGDQAGNPSKEMACSKLNKATRNTSMDLGISHRDGNHSQRKNIANNNKQNKPHHVGHPTSARKNTQQKYTSYAEIFDKKSSMNALIHSQKSKGNSGSRQMGAVRKEKNSLRSMAVSEQKVNIELTSQFSVQLDTFVNGFQLEGFNEEIERISEGFNEEIQGMSRVNECENQAKVVQVTQNNTITPSSQTPKAIKINEPEYSPHSSRLLTLTSQTINQHINFTQEYARIRKQQQKQLIVLAKQNATFKRELATFRKDNSTFRKELDKAKEYIGQLEEKAQGLIQQLQQQNQDIAGQHKIIQKTANLKECLRQSNGPMNIPSSIMPDPSLQQILISTQQQLFSLKSNNKALQLKVYMLEKKLAHEQELSKKRLALEAYSWRDKYNKLRNENTKLKNQMHPFNSDLSFSMDISREE